MTDDTWPRLKDAMERLITRTNERRKELTTLRMGVARIAQVLDINPNYLPGETTSYDLDQLVSAIEVDRGWNRLCAIIVDEIVELKSPDLEIELRKAMHEGKEESNEK